MSAELAILGAGGLSGRELIGLLNQHKDLELVHITSNQVEGKSLEEAYPTAKYKKKLIFQNHNAPIPKNAVCVLATPNEVSHSLAPKLLDMGHKVIDLSGAYRLHDQQKFEEAYKMKHEHFALMKKVVFGLSEVNREALRGTDFVSNPGCFPVSSIHAIRLFQKYYRGKIVGISIDSKTGVSGAGGRTEDIAFTFTNTYENFRAYKILSHQHEPEIREYAIGNDSPIPLVFTPHLLPVYRGILSTITFFLESSPDTNVVDSLRQECEKEPFFRFVKTPEEIELKNVQHTNFLDISLKLRGNTAVMVTAIDNLVKGASGQALQNINLMCNLEEKAGLLPQP